MMILNVTKNHVFTLSLEDTFLEEPQEGQIDPPIDLGLIFLRLIDFYADFCWLIPRHNKP